MDAVDTLAVPGRPDNVVPRGATRAWRRMISLRTGSCAPADALGPFGHSGAPR